jgi:hypothetical protein
MRQALPALRLNQPGAVVGEQLRFGVIAARSFSPRQKTGFPSIRIRPVRCDQYRRG